MKHVFKQILAVVVIVAMLASFTACEIFGGHTHTYSEWGSNKTHHWKYCPEDEERDEESLEKHFDENADGKCDACGYDVGMPHVHDYSAWGSDAENHWKYCPADNAKDSSTIAPHADEDKDGKCDSCGTDMEAPVEEYVAIETVSGVLTLVVKGPMPEGVACVRLHAEGNSNHYYWNNSSKFDGAYEFSVPLTDLSVDGTPWYFFHIYAYTESSPSDATEPAEKVNLPRGELITLDQKIEHDGLKYVIINHEESGQLVIQPNKIPDATVSSIEIKVVDGKPLLVVKGTVRDGLNVASLMLHADGNGSDEFFGTPAAVVDGAFELTFDLSKTPLDGTPWLWFHVYTYATETAPDKDAAYTGKFDLSRGSLISAGQFIDCNGVRYTVIDRDQLVLQPTETPKMTVTSISLELDESGKPFVVVKGTLPTDIACIKLHADAANVHYFGDNVSTEAGKFELRFDATQIPVENTPWAWFHIYTYSVAEPEDLTKDYDKVDLSRGDHIAVGEYVDYNGIRYTVQDQGQLVVQATVIQ